MIIVERVEGHPDLIKRHSDQGFYIQNDQTGEKYGEAIDIEGLYTYTETDELIPIEDNSEEVLEEV